MHLIDTRIGHYGSSSIVGGGIPIATGMGLAIKMQKRRDVSVVFFGDGAADEGVLYESINFAMLKKLPVIFILENNQYSVCSHISSRQATRNVFHRMPQESLMSALVDGNDVLKVYEHARRAIHRARLGRGPAFIECRTYRVRGHAGTSPQDPSGYRTRKEIKFWEARCPLAGFQKRLIGKGIITRDEVKEMEGKIQMDIEKAFRLAQQAPFPSPESLSRFLFQEST